MGSTERRARERHATRERILAAARALFVKEGFEAVSMRKIAAAIEYTPAAIYTHFKDKTELLMALGDSDFGLMRDSMRDVEKIADPVERLRACGRAYIRFALEHPHHYRLMFMTSWPYIEPKDCLIEHGNADEDAHAFLCGLVRECIQAGRLRPKYRDAHTTTQACWAAAHGVVSLYITHGSDPWVDFKHPRETAELLLDAAIDGMLNPTPARDRTPRTRVAKVAPDTKARRRA
ncbi:MAG: TetR/AcrR family transcriptional regulator [Planctomycetes bacterium]|nr:TetR/AcrR family transcriptional regulator [Planctomycetota bacterium]